MLHLAGIDYESFCDGEGVSTVLYISGCKHNCRGCHNPDTHDFDHGISVTDDVIKKINKEIKKRPFINTIVFSGGDPMYSAHDVSILLDKLDKTNKKIWCYTGFTFEEILDNKEQFELLKKCDVLVDGLFKKDLKDITLAFRGSRNQRVIDIQETLKHPSKITLYI